MNQELVKTLIFAVAFSTLTVIAYHYVLRVIRTRQMMRVLAETLLKNHNGYQDQMDKHFSPEIKIRRRFTKKEDKIILHSTVPVRMIAESLGRSVTSIYVRRHNLKKNAK